MLSPLPRYDITKYGKFEIRPYKLGSAFVSVWPRALTRSWRELWRTGLPLWRFSGSSRLGGKGKEKAREERWKDTGQYHERGLRTGACAWRPNSRHDGLGVTKEFTWSAIGQSFKRFFSLLFPIITSGNFYRLQSAIYHHHYIIKDGKDESQRSPLFFVYTTT